MSDMEVVAQVYEAFAERDLERLLDLSADDCVITQDERLPWGGRHVGHQGVTDFAAMLITSDRLRADDRGHVRGGWPGDPGGPHHRHGAVDRSSVRHPRGAHLDGCRREGRQRALRQRHRGHARGPRRRIVKAGAQGHASIRVDASPARAVRARVRRRPNGRVESRVPRLRVDRRRHRTGSRRPLQGHQPPWPGAVVHHRHGDRGGPRTRRSRSSPATWAGR